MPIYSVVREIRDHHIFHFSSDAKLISNKESCSKLHCEDLESIVYDDGTVGVFNNEQTHILARNQNATCYGVWRDEHTCCYDLFCSDEGTSDEDNMASPMYEKVVWNQVLDFHLYSMYPPLKITTKQKNSWRQRAKKYMVRQEHDPEKVLLYYSAKPGKSKLTRIQKPKASMHTFSPHDKHQKSQYHDIGLSHASNAHLRSHCSPA